MNYLKPLLSQTELHTMQVLIHTVPHSLYVWPKIKISDFIMPTIDNTQTDFLDHFSKIKEKYIHFTLLEKTNFTPILFIEPEHTPHEHRTALDTISNKIEVPILYVNFEEYIPYKDAFEYDSLRQSINNILVLKKEKKY